jgi:hypothetical protein
MYHIVVILDGKSESIQADTPLQGVFQRFYLNPANISLPEGIQHKTPLHNLQRENEDMILRCIENKDGKQVIRDLTIQGPYETQESILHYNKKFEAEHGSVTNNNVGSVTNSNVKTPNNKNNQPQRSHFSVDKEQQQSRWSFWCNVI